MRETEALRECRETIMDHGMAHLIYQEKDYYDIVHPYSVPDYELVTDEFYDFLEKYRKLIPYTAPIVLEITGKQQSREEKKIITNAIRTQAMLDLTQTRQETRTYAKKCLFYLFCTILASGLVIAFGALEQEILADLVYILFWFFGERLLDYLVIRLFPSLEEGRWYERLSAMKVLFTEKPDATLAALDLEQIKEEREEKEVKARKEVLHNQMLEEYLMEDGIVLLGCRVQELDDVIEFPELKQRQVLSTDMAGYLEQGIPFLKKDARVQLEVQGPQFNEAEQEAIRNAVQNYYYVRRAEEEHEIIYNRRNILAFAVFVIISALVLSKSSLTANLAGYEFILMIFWFFADWLLEFILITNQDIRKDIAKMDACKNMEITFVTVQQ